METTRQRTMRTHLGSSYASFIRNSATNDESMQMLAPETQLNANQSDLDATVLLEYARDKSTEKVPPALALFCLAAIPIVAWCYNAIFVSPHANAAGEFAFIEFGRFVLVAAPPMYVAQLVSAYFLGRYEKRRLIVLFVFLANLTPFCYLKILLVGPTFGTFF